MSRSDETQKDPTTPTEAEVKMVELPELLGKVEYVYTNHARLSTSKWDIRIAFGDIDPTGHLEPKFGVILPHIVAKGLLKALTRMVEATEKRLGEIIDPTEDTIEIAVEAEVPPRAET